MNLDSIKLICFSAILSVYLDSISRHNATYPIGRKTSGGMHFKPYKV